MGAYVRGGCSLWSLPLLICWRLPRRHAAGTGTRCRSCCCAAPCRARWRWQPLGGLRCAQAGGPCARPCASPCRNQGQPQVAPCMFGAAATPDAPPTTILPLCSSSTTFIRHTPWPPACCLPCTPLSWLRWSPTVAPQPPGRRSLSSWRRQRRPRRRRRRTAPQGHRTGGGSRLLAEGAVLTRCARAQVERRM